ncbi:MAG: glycosyltransferase family 4 protein [Elusimicrobiota bacterium]|jgi:glycosyltransferase involved in cell wall biosynthesis
MKLRVCHIITQLELGGAQQNTLYTLSHLDSNRFDVSLICGAGGFLDEEAKRGNWPTFFVSSLVRLIRPIQDLLALLSLYRLLRQQKPHIVHTHSSKAGILGRIAAYLAGVPVIIHTFHGFGFTPKQAPGLRKIFIALEKFCALLSIHLIFVSEDNRTEAAELGIGRRTPNSLIRSGIVFQRAAKSRVRQELGISSKAWVVVSIGNFKLQKNPMDLVRVASEVLKKKANTHFILVGDGELRPSVETWCQEQGIGASIHFVGWRQDIPEILAAANGFLLTSLWEGLPRALVEASAAQLPCVAYGVNGVKDILQDGQTGFLILPGDVSSAAEKIVWLQDHPEEGRRLGQAAARRVGDEFNIDRMVHQQEELYNDLYENVPLKDYYESRWNVAK